MKICLGWMVVGLGMALPLIGETKPYRLPELLPPASEPRPMNYPDWRSEDPEVFVALLEKNQASLSDYDRVWLLARAAEKYGNANAHPNFKRSGPARALIELAFKAARGAESSETIDLRRLRVRLAWEIHPDVGRRETDETRAEINAIPIETVSILGNHGDRSPTPADRQRLKEMIESWDEPIEHLKNPDLTDRKVSSKLPRLKDLPYQDPHTKSMSAVNSPLAHSYADIHRQHVSEFVGQTGFGVAREVRIDQRQAYRDGEGSYWRVTRAHLVSFLEREEPVVYQMEKDRLAGMRGTGQPVNSETVLTRPLTSFEKSAFNKAIETGKPEIVESATLTRMVAPILAEASCARCHDLDVGDPLGAFSYDIEPDPSAAKHFEPRYQRKLEREKKLRAAQKKDSR